MSTPATSSSRPAPSVDRVLGAGAAGLGLGIVGFNTGGNVVRIASGYGALDNPWLERWTPKISVAAVATGAATAAISLLAQMDERSGTVGGAVPAVRAAAIGGAVLGAASLLPTFSSVGRTGVRAGLATATGAVYGLVAQEVLKSSTS